jgi:zinc transport system substrate-binding protein
MRRRAIGLAVGIALLATGTACSPTSGGRGNVVASVYPLAFLTMELAGDDVEVVTLASPGSDAHDLELTPRQARTIAEAKLVVYLGGGFQPAVEAAVEAAGNGLDVLELVATHRGDEEAEEEHGDEVDEHAHDGVDPHVWLDPQNAADIAAAISERLKEAEPGAASAINDRLIALTDRLEELDRSLTDGLADCERDTVVVSHEAFGYLTRRYGLHQVGIAGLNPHQEPSAQRLAEVARLVAAEDIDTIYLERFVPSDIGETLARETGAQVAALDPLEFQPESGDYFSTMEANRDLLIDGLGCDSGV